jgi:hypothetical protein
MEEQILAALRRRREDVLLELTAFGRARSARSAYGSGVSLPARYIDREG